MSTPAKQSSKVGEKRAVKRGPTARKPALRVVATANLDTIERLLEPREKIVSAGLVRRGIPARLVKIAAQRYGISQERFVDVLGVSKPTLNRLERGNKAMHTVTSDVFKDAANVLQKALDASGGDKAVMNGWLNSVVPALGCKPIELLGTKDGRELVSTTIDRARYGVFA